MDEELKTDSPEPQDKPVRTHTKNGRELTKLELMFKRPPGRPPVEIEWEDAELYAMYGGTLAGISSALGIGQTAFISAIQKKYNKTFGEWATALREKADLALQGELVERAISGDASLLRFLAERRLGMTHKVEVTHKSAADQMRERFASMTAEQRQQELAQIKAEMLQLSTNITMQETIPDAEFEDISQDDK